MSVKILYLSTFLKISVESLGVSESLANEVKEEISETENELLDMDWMEEEGSQLNIYLVLRYFFF